jgi:hypothetical protein
MPHLLSLIINKIKIIKIMKTYITTLIIIVSFIIPNVMLASEVSGTLTGVVKAPVVIPPGGGNPSGGSSNNNNNSTSTKKGDANKDGKVDVLDFVLLMAQWNKTGNNLSADFNSDNKVDILDFVILMANWNK